MLQKECRQRLRRLFRHLTVLWAVLGLIKAGVMLWLLQSQSLETFVVLRDSLDVRWGEFTKRDSSIVLRFRVKDGSLAPLNGAPRDAVRARRCGTSTGTW